MKTRSADKKHTVAKQSLEKNELLKTVIIDDLFSAALKHNIKLEVILPPWYDETPQFSFKVLFINDGQSLHRVKMKEALLSCYFDKSIPPIIIVGIHAHDRMQEYGIAGAPDYKARGNKADKYSRCLVNEVLPLIKKNFRVLEGAENTAIAGFSLGGLSAFDIAWNYPLIFSTAGVFSGSFWWRSKGYGKGYDNDSDRIMQKLVRGTDSKSNQRFWFECGTEDETADRNNNGIIDSIEDTLDIIKELKDLGFEEGEDVEYVEVVGGQHNEETWAKVMPNFLRWAFRH